MCNNLFMSSNYSHSQNYFINKKKADYIMSLFKIRSIPCIEVGAAKGFFTQRLSLIFPKVVAIKELEQLFEEISNFFTVNVYHLKKQIL